jgi:hypothetical protein
MNHTSYDPQIVYLLTCLSVRLSFLPFVHTSIRTLAVLLIIKTMMIIIIGSIALSWPWHPQS